MTDQEAEITDVRIALRDKHTKGIDDWDGFKTFNKEAIEKDYRQLGIVQSVPDPYYLDKKVKLVELFSYHKLGLTNKYTHLFGDS